MSESQTIPAPAGAEGVALVDSVAPTHPGTSRSGMRARRLLVLALNMATVGALIAVMAMILSEGGWSWLDVLMLPAFAITLPWLSIGLWNALIGFVIQVLARDPALYVAPTLAAVRRSGPIRSRVAVTMTLRHEDVPRALARLKAVQESLDATGQGSHFEFHILSDSERPDVTAQEEQLAAALQALPAMRGRLFYRRRAQNTGFKAGNLREFVERCGADYDLFVPLDADSLMSGDAILRLVRVMEDRPEIGILQGLVVGMPAETAFTRAFQFGMRHGMRSYTTGSAWWQGDCGPFWGHNAVIRVAPFRDHCALPVLAGEPPRGGPVLSHDQVEAVMMRRHGYEVRVFAEEDESYEENPPDLPSFIKRDLRWCQGNMQYLCGPILGMQRLRPLSRLQLGLAILMYVGAPGWMGFILLATAQIALMSEPVAPLTATLGIGLFITIMAIALMPKIMGVADILVHRRRRRAYGGGARVIAGAVLEFLYSMLLSPVIGFAQARFMAALARGRRVMWDGQRRDASRLSVLDALRGLWPQTLFGVLILAVTALTNPGLLIFVSPLLAAFLLAAPLTSLMASRRLGRATRRLGLFDIPEDRTPTPVQGLLRQTEAVLEDLATHPDAAAAPRKAA